jgi:hypothetical protein
MKSDYQQPLLYSSTVVLLTVAFSGCALTRGDDGQRFRISNNLTLYEMFDNSRDWGPSYLVGAPDRHFGYGARVDDSRSSLTPPLH